MLSQRVAPIHLIFNIASYAHFADEETEAWGC